MYIKMTAESFPVNGVKCLRFDGVTEMTENQTTADKFEGVQRGWEEGGQIISPWVHFVICARKHTKLVLRISAKLYTYDKSRVYI